MNWLRKQRLSDSPQLYLIIILLLALGLRSIALNQSFWLDEAAQAILSANPFNLAQFRGDFQPPLSYIFTYGWIEFGNMLGLRSEWFLRLPMVLIGTGTVFMLFQLLKEAFNKRVGLLAGLMLATAPFHIYYSQEFRMYSMLTFLSVLSWYVLWKKEWKWFSVVTAIGIFTHYFFFILIAAQTVYVLLTDRPNVQKFFIHTALGVAPFLLWMPTFISQLDTAHSLVSAWPGWKNISNTGFVRFPGLVLAKFTVGLISPTPRILYGAFVGAMGLVMTASSYVQFKMYQKQSKIRPALLLVICMFAIPLIFAWIGGIFISASSPWRIQFVLPGMYALIAVSAAWLIDGELKKSFLGFFTRMYARLRGMHDYVIARNIGYLIVVFVVLQNLYFSSQYLLKEFNHRENWRDAVSYTDMLAADENATVITEFNHLWAPMEWYSMEKDSYMRGSTAQRITPKSAEEALEPIVAEGEPIVLYTYLFELSDPEMHIDAYLQTQNYTLDSQKDFRGVGILNIYKLEKEN